MPALDNVFNVKLVLLTRAVDQEKIIKAIQIRKKES
jgi:hypothetical protein